jgi:hypothetical protein
MVSKNRGGLVMVGRRIHVSTAQRLERIFFTIRLAVARDPFLDVPDELTNTVGAISAGKCIYWSGPREPIFQAL